MIVPAIIVNLSNASKKGYCLRTIVQNPEPKLIYHDDPCASFLRSSRSAMNHLVTVTGAGIFECMKIELIKCPPDMERWIVVYKPLQHLCVWGELPGKLHFHSDLGNFPQHISEDGHLALSLRFISPAVVHNHS